MNFWPLLILSGLSLLCAGIVWCAIRELMGMWTGRTSHRGASGGGLMGGLAEIDRLVRPSMVHVERVDEEAESEQENDGD